MSRSVKAKEKRLSQLQGITHAPILSEFSILPALPIRILP
jgi:hypothetical protein